MALIALVGCATGARVPFRMYPYNHAFPPYHVIGNIYYVGTSEIAQFLITTPSGHILLDSGFEESVPRLRDNVRKVGFRFEDIKILLSSHAHIDHVQAHALVRQLTGAQVVASAADAAYIRAGGRGETVFDGVYEWPPCSVDRVIGDRDEVTLGGISLTARLTPGHTRGATTYTMRVTEAGKPLDVVFFPSANVNPGVRLVGNARYPSIASDFERSFAVWKSLPCDVFLGSHGSFYDMKTKYGLLRGGPAVNPFIDPAGYKHAIADAERAFLEELASER